jgi:hypothetical protein
MNKRDATKIAKRTYRNLQPRLAFGFSTVRGVVMVTLSDSTDLLVLYNPTDIYRLRSVCDVVIQALEAKEAKRYRQRQRKRKR